MQPEPSPDDGEWDAWEKRQARIDELIPQSGARRQRLDLVERARRGVRRGFLEKPK